MIGAALIAFVMSVLENIGLGNKGAIAATERELVSLDRIQAGTSTPIPV